MINIAEDGMHIPIDEKVRSTLSCKITDKYITGNSYNNLSRRIRNHLLLTFRTPVVRNLKQKFNG